MSGGWKMFLGFPFAHGHSRKHRPVSRAPICPSVWRWHLTQRQALRSTWCVWWAKTRYRWARSYQIRGWGNRVRRGCCSSGWISAHPLLVFVLLKLAIVIENRCEHQQVSATTHTSIFGVGGEFLRILEPDIGGLFVPYLKCTFDRWRKLALISMHLTSVSKTSLQYGWGEWVFSILEPGDIKHRCLSRPVVLMIFCPPCRLLSAVCHPSLPGSRSASQRIRGKPFCAQKIIEWRFTLWLQAAG